MIQWIRSCLVCRSQWFGNELFCHCCWKEIIQRSPRRLFQRASEEFDGSHYYLWEWTPSSELIPPLIYALKSQELSCFKRKWIEELLVRVPLSQMSADHIVYLAREGSHFDHTRILAEKISELLSCPVDQIFLKAESENYKRLKRADRLRVRKAKPLSLPGVNEKRVLFVDDVYTSGASAKAAWEALGKPQDFVALTLAFKRYEGG